MAVRIRQQIIAAVSSSTSEDKDLGNINFQIVTDGHTSGGCWKTKLSASATNVLLQIDNLATIRYVLIRGRTIDPTQVLPTITLKRNSTGGEALPMAPLTSVKESYFMMTTDTSLTGIYATNTGSVDCELTVMAVGD